MRTHPPGHLKKESDGARLLFADKHLASRHRQTLVGTLDIGDSNEREEGSKAII